jgi:hypothetical protein
MGYEGQCVKCGAQTEINNSAGWCDSCVNEDVERRREEREKNQE